jgi:hypothetical protein
MVLHAFPSMSVSSLHAFQENCVYRHGGFNCFMRYLHRKLLTTNFSLMILKVLKNVHLLDLYIKTMIFLFYSYIHVFNSSQNDWTFWYKSVISSIEVYDKHVITCHFSYHTLYQPSFIYHPLSVTALGLIKGMIWKMPCDNLYLFSYMKDP